MTTEETLLRLLGNEGVAFDCDACFDVLDRYVELELAGAAADAAVPGLREHLSACPACAEEYESLRALVELEEEGS
jgi:predicted anti-sigma-YlaC factor YlaD